jgi:hypothetical protein
MLCFEWSQFVRAKAIAARGSRSVFSGDIAFSAIPEIGH